MLTKIPLRFTRERKKMWFSINYSYCCRLFPFWAALPFRWPFLQANNSTLPPSQSHYSICPFCLFMMNSIFFSRCCWMSIAMKSCDATGFLSRNVQKHKLCEFFTTHIKIRMHLRRIKWHASTEEKKCYKNITDCFFVPPNLEWITCANNNNSRKTQTNPQ